MPKSTSWRLAGLSPVPHMAGLSAPLQHSLCFFQPLSPTFPDALRLRFYPANCGRERRASVFRINDKCVGLGPSCLPTDLHLSRTCGIKHLYLASPPFWSKRISLILPTTLVVFNDTYNVVSFSSLLTLLRQLRNVHLIWPYPQTRALNRY